MYIFPSNMHTTVPIIVSLATILSTPCQNRVGTSLQDCFDSLWLRFNKTFRNIPVRFWCLLKWQQINQLQIHGEKLQVTNFLKMFCTSDEAIGEQRTPRCSWSDLDEMESSAETQLVLSDGHWTKYCFSNLFWSSFGVSVNCSLSFLLADRKLHLIWFSAVVAHLLQGLVCCAFTDPVLHALVVTSGYFSYFFLFVI